MKSQHEKVELLWIMSVKQFEGARNKSEKTTRTKNNNPGDQVNN